MTEQRKFWWGDLPASAFARIDAEKTIAILPVAAIEQHGPHLPLSTDSAIMEGMLGHVFGQLPAALDARFLPIQQIGKSTEHIRTPGTLTISPAALIDAWTDIGASVARAGIRKLVVVNSHGGNEEVVGIMTRELRARFDMLAVKTSWERFGHPAGCYSTSELRFGIHGGDVETSLMLHFRPDLVDMKKAGSFASATEESRTDLQTSETSEPARIRLAGAGSEPRRRRWRRRRRDRRKGPAHRRTPVGRFRRTPQRHSQSQIGELDQRLTIFPPAEFQLVTVGDRWENSFQTLYSPASWLYLQ
jgi:creatinine amidohydrolase